ncbi:MAG TPA: hypothetical protein VGG74_24030 [Kofleriaceae bacterium]|jgi:hypothetical protein
MSTIGGPGGIGGPKGPKPPDDVGEVGDASGVEDAGRVGDVAATQPSELDAIAADLSAGKLTPREAVDKLVDQIANGSELDASDRAELRELMAELVANDPHLGALLNRL